MNTKNEDRNLCINVMQTNKVHVTQTNSPAVHHLCIDYLNFQVSESSTLILQLLPLLRGITLWRPRMNRRNLILEHGVD